MDETPGDKESPPAKAATRSAIELLGGDAGCILLSIPLSVCLASYYTFQAAAAAGSPWAGAAAVAALAAMGFGIFWVAIRSRA